MLGTKESTGKKNLNPKPQTLSPINPRPNPNAHGMDVAMLGYLGGRLKGAYCADGETHPQPSPK